MVARRDKAHDAYVAKTYGLQRGDYADLLATQGGVCAICGKRPRARKLAVDHDHYTGRVRGLLCFMCNSALGTFEFDAATAERARDYLAAIVKEFALRAPLVESDSQSNRKMRVRVTQTGDLPF